MKAAYQHLPPEIKEAISDLKALHCYDYSYSPGKVLPSRIRDAAISADQPRATYPVALIHPETGERVLYVSPRNTDRVLNVSGSLSEELLNKLWSVALAPENIYAHKWEVGDLLIWDNYAVLHGRRDYNPKYTRQLRRMCVL
jgi:taurine dioxygenase